MGVPKFYRWISERYPCLSEVINDSQIPEFDNLYLDMNGIIHNCSHPNDDDISFRITEEQIYQDIFAYIEKLFHIIRPKKVFYMAVDGVAPRAKMNQQRARRFMSARTASEQLDKAKKRGDDIPEEARFDSNCITPGTYFMTRLHNELCAFVERKVNTDPKWQNIRIYLSGHNCPGEGEHKIMDFIRAERATEGYDPNTRHCMYGLDADLIMLGLCSHEPHFSLLREEVKFNSRPQRKGPKKDNKKENEQKRAKPTEIAFHLLHLSLLREYLAWEFHSLKDNLSFPYDMERIVDDWVLMGFLVGNDFIPHLPHVHIHDDGLPLLYDTYKKVLPGLDGYINDFGVLNLKRFEIFLKAVAENDRNHFLQKMEDDSFLKAKRAANSRDGGPVAPPGAYDALLTVNEENELVAFEDSDMSSATESEGEGEEEDSEETSGEAAFVSSDEEEELSDTPKSSSESDSNNIASAADTLANLDLEDPAEDEFSQQLALSEFMPRSEKEFENNVEACWSRSIGNSFKRHKREYYREKLKYTNISKDQLKSQSEGYVRAIQWVLHYYYHGCVSWNWYFEHHYAPYISDVTDFADMEMTFDLSEPFHPFEQLLAVLPAASAECLPIPLRELMCSTESPIADFYPTEFKTDLNGKKNDWEAVVLIPFIDEKRLLEAIQSKASQLTKEENERNSHGPHVLFTTDSNGPAAKAKVTMVDKDLFRLPKEKVTWGLLPNVKMDVFFPGFPTMKHLPHIGQLKQVNVNVFNQPSKKSSMVLKILEREDLNKEIPELAKELIGKEVCVEWPVLKMGIVDSIIAANKKYVATKDKGIEEVELTQDEAAVNAKRLRDIKDRQMARFAIDVSLSKVLVLVKRFLGISYEAKGGVLVPSKQYGGVDNAIAVPLDLVVSNITVEEGKRLSEIPVNTAFPSKSKVFVMDPSWTGFGYPALVDKVEHSGEPNCRVLVMAAIAKQPDLSKLKADLEKFSLPWYSSHEAGRKAGVRGKLFGRITGTMFLYHGERENEERGMGNNIKINMGMSLKFTKRNLEVPDYTRKTENNYWQYSNLVVNLLREYKEKFADLFNYLENTETADDVYYTHDIWEEETVREKRWEELSEYLKSLPTCAIEKQTCGVQTADVMMLSHIEKSIRETPKQSMFLKSSVNPSKIFRAELFDGKVRPDPEADFEVLDRVVNTVAGSPVPLGLQGTIIGVSEDKVEVMFDREFTSGYRRVNLNSCARVPIPSLINITFGRERKGKPKAIAVRPAPSTPQRMVAGKDPVFGPYSTKRDKPKEYSKKEKDFKKKEDWPSTSSSNTPPVKLAQRSKAEKAEKKKDNGGVKFAARPVAEDPEKQKQIVQDTLNSILGIGKKTTSSEESKKESAKKEEVEAKKENAEVKKEDVVDSKKAKEEEKEESKLDKNMKQAVNHHVNGGVRVFTNSTTAAIDHHHFVNNSPSTSPTKPFPSKPFPKTYNQPQGGGSYGQPPANVLNGTAPKLMQMSNADKVSVTDMKPRSLDFSRARGGGRGGKKFTPSRPAPSSNASAPSNKNSEKVEESSGNSSSQNTGGKKRRERKSRLAMALPKQD